MKVARKKNRIEVYKIFHVDNRLHHVQILCDFFFLIQNTKMKERKKSLEERFWSSHSLTDHKTTDDYCFSDERKRETEREGRKASTPRFEY